MNSEYELKRRSSSPESPPHRRRRGESSNKELKRIDYVLIYELDEEEKDDAKTQEKNKLRNKFKEAIWEEGLEMQEDEITDSKNFDKKNIFIKIHVPFERICTQAERVAVEMNIRGLSIPEDPPPSYLEWFYEFERKHLKTDNEAKKIFTIDGRSVERYTVDSVATTFEKEKMKIFENHSDVNTFFRPALRCFLANDILINIDIRDEADRQNEPLNRKGLKYMLMEKIFLDAFIMHDESDIDPMEEEEKKKKEREFGSRFVIDDPPEGKKLILPDTRKELHESWLRYRKYQPLWKIRNYFGEKISLYFAWVGTLIVSLWIPTLLGLAIFFYGLYLSIEHNINNTNQLNATDPLTLTKSYVERSIQVIRQAFDNKVTPYYALIMCLWGTLFLEFWKRKNAELAYRWDVDYFEETEPDRPQFQGTQKKRDPVTQEEIWYYPFKRQLFKFMFSFSILITMVFFVLISVAMVILYRVYTAVNLCSDPKICIIVNALVPALLNAISIMLLGKLYEILAYKLTNWENHRTQTQYDDALIIKLFAFQFANSYASLFYIAFFRGINYGKDGIFGLGEKYTDSCGTDNNCMAMLSLQVLVLMIVKPLPKFLKDIILPWLLKKWRLRKICRGKRRVDDTESAQKKKSLTLPDFLERERLKPELGDFTLGEYTEKVLIYGYLMIFAASLPVAPLIALIVYLIDIRVDAGRLLWWYRRPISTIAQDIGMWYGILYVLNVIGVISNACLIAFTSHWGRSFDETYKKLLIVIGFEHIVFFVKFVIDLLIPDTPAWVCLRRRKEKYQVAKILEAARRDPNINPADVVKPKEPGEKHQKTSYLSSEEKSKLLENNMELRERSSMAENSGKKKKKYKLKPLKARGDHEEEVYSDNRPLNNRRMSSESIPR
ncbi:DgyrCDS6968 [Dimorphilus gyrociliatus]|uniref:Anoctamin n=1 Tax=Dimorphilus gyrociliatus TaxID=2664684 RepID=A0A7I8VPT5_9ANNE|nr:DgyrCDS6968 [Dimorphilus gyrociliatus]